MLTRISIILILSAVFLSPIEGQFGVGKRKNQGGTSFQELNEQAKNMVGGGGNAGMPDMEELMKQMMGDGDMKKGLENLGLGPEMDEMMKLMADMSPEDLAKQLQDAMEMFTGDDMMSNMIGHSDEILETLEKTGAVDAEELEKFKKNPEYFEQKMKESMDQMKQLWSNPEMMENVGEGMKAAQNLYNNPDSTNEMIQQMLKGLSDEDIESVRQMFLEDGDGGDPMMRQLFGSMDTKDLEDVLKDPITWRKTVKDGLGLFNQQGNAGIGAGVGEL